MNAKEPEGNSSKIYREVNKLNNDTKYFNSGVTLCDNNTANKISRSLGKEIILETRKVALADGVEVSEDECLFMFNKIVDSNQTNKSSMAFDVQYKRKTEIDFISGVVSKMGKKHGINTPLNDLMYKMIKVKEGMYS